MLRGQNKNSRVLSRTRLRLKLCFDLSFVVPVRGTLTPTTLSCASMYKRLPAISLFDRRAAACLVRFGPGGPAGSPASSSAKYAKQFHRSV